MNKYKFLSTLVFDQPQLCTPQYAETVLTVLGDKFDLDTSEMSIVGSEREASGPNIQGNGTLVIPILGSMVNRAGFLDVMSGVQSYGAIQSQIEEGLQNPSITSILLEMDSPGGTVAGAFDLRDYILSIRGQKPIVALATDTMASAAYLIGSACDKVYTTQTGQVGSIGVVAMHMDTSARNKAQGVKPTFIYAGDFKIAGNPHEPLQGEALNYLQESVNDSYEMFVNAVSEARGLDPQVVRDTEARMYRGKKSVDAGLSDGVMTLEQTLEELANSAQRVQKPMSINQKGMKMDKEELETMQADLAKVQKDNEALRAAILGEGYKITATGIEKEVAEVEDTPETMEFGGEKVNVADIPAAVLKQLQEDAQVKADFALGEKAKTILPNFALETAKELLSVDLSEETMATLKAADTFFKKTMSETGEAHIQSEMVNPKERLKELAIETQKAENITYEQAYSKIVMSKEGMALVKAMKEENE